MIYIRPQKIYKPSSASSIRPNDDLGDLSKRLPHFKITIEAARGFTLSKDTSQLTFTAHIFRTNDGSEVTAALRERGYKPEWLLGSKPLPEACITDSGYTATLGSKEVTAFFENLILQAKEDELLLVLADLGMRTIVRQVLDAGAFAYTTIKASERILNRILMDSIRQGELTVINEQLRLIDSSLDAKADAEDVAKLSDEVKGINDHPSVIDADTGLWKVWDNAKKEYVLTQNPSKGADGKDAVPVRANMLSMQRVRKANHLKTDTDINSTIYKDFSIDSNGVMKWTQKSYGTQPLNLTTDEMEAEVTYVFSVISDRPFSRKKVYNGKWYEGEEERLGENLYRLCVAVSLDAGGNRINFYGCDPIKNEDGTYSPNTQLFWNFKVEAVRSGEPAVATAFIPHPLDITPTISLDDKFRLVSNGELVSSESLKGRDGKDVDPAVVDNLTRLIKGKVSKEDYIADKNSITDEIGKLHEADLTDAERIRLADLSASFNALRAADDKLSGLTLTNFIALSNDKGAVTAYISGNGSKEAVLMAGIRNFGKATQTDKVAIFQDGTGHFDNLYFGGDRVDFKTSEKEDPKLSIIMKEALFIEELIKNNRFDKTVQAATNEGGVELNSSKPRIDLTLEVPFDSTRLDISIGRIFCEVYNKTLNANAAERELQVILDGTEVLSRWRGTREMHLTPQDPSFGGGFIQEIVEIPTEGINLHYTRYVKKGTHKLSIAIITAGGLPIERSKATIERVVMRGFYSSEVQQSVIHGSGVRFFGGLDRYVDIDYRKTYYHTPQTPTEIGGWTSNPYLMRIKGGMKADSLTLNEPIEAPGCVLAGGSVRNGYMQVSFGKYKYMKNTKTTRAEFNNTTKVYTVYHSIGHTKYTPIVTSCAGQWGDVPQVVSVSAYSFGVKFINYNNQTNYGWDFNYVCYKGD